MSRNTGIWLDRKQAYIVHLENGEELVKTIDSGVDFQERIPGESDSRGRLRFRGKGDGVETASQEKSEQNRQQKFLNAYYEEIASHLKNSEKVYIFGPAEAKTELHKLLKSDNTFKTEIIEVETADSMTENQMRAKVRDHFTKNN